jgi:hypothetical protein
MMCNSWDYWVIGQVPLATCFTLVSCSAYPSTLKMEATCSPKTSLTFSGLHGVTSQKIVLLITTAVRTSNPTQCNVKFSLML